MRIGEAHTGLGEESAEAVVRVSGLAFLSEEAIGLCSTGQYGPFACKDIGEDAPGCHAQGSKAAES